MAEMGYGYGSEFQLLRYLGHHRNELNETIKKQVKGIDEIHWLDFPHDANRISLDGEYKGISFLSAELKETIKNDWKIYWTGNTQNWDGIFLSDEKIYIVEAKAHLGELKSSFDSSDLENRKKIEYAMKETKEKMGVAEGKNWLGQYYQLANRLAFLNFLRKNKIESHLVYIYFLNGYRKRVYDGKRLIEQENKNVDTQDEWESAIIEQYKELGLMNVNLDDYLFKVFIDCEKRRPITAST